MTSYHDKIKSLVHAFPANAPVFAQDMDLARMVLVDDLTSQRTWLRFSRKVLWTRQIEASAELMKAGRSIRPGSSFIDNPHGGALGRALEQARAIAKDLDLTPGSDLSCQVFLSVHDIPTLDLEGDLAAFRDKYNSRPQRLRVPPMTWVQDNPEMLDSIMSAMEKPLLERIEMDLQWPWVVDRQIVPEQCVWSSSSQRDLAIDDEALVGKWVAALASLDPDTRLLLPARPAPAPHT